MRLKSWTGSGICFLTFLWFSYLDASAQQSACPPSTGKKAMKYFGDASSLYKSRKYEEAMKAVANAIEEDPEFADAYLLQGTIARKRKDYETMEQSFGKVAELCPDADPGIYFELGSYYYYLRKWKEAENNFGKFLSYDRIDEGNASKAELWLARAKLYSHPVPFNPVPVLKISTPDPEYLPYISPDNELAFFTRRFDVKDKNMLTPQSVEKFMVAHLQKDRTYDAGEPMPAPFNRSGSNNEGGATITIDDKHLYFTVNVRGNFDICTSDYADGNWSEIRNLGPHVNDPLQWDSQPTISSDGKTLYFSSARDSITGLDIYKTTKSTSGEWTRAVKLGSGVNTNGNEKSPFLHSDSKTLYFSSDSLPGLGGYDIFMCKMDENGNWGKPVNLGYPINTEADEVGFFVSTDGRTGYFASNKLNVGAGGYDIYAFDLHPDVRPNKVYFQKGDMNGMTNSEPVQATIEIRDAVTSKLTKIDVDSVSGEYAFVVDFDHDLLVSVKKEGYAFESRYVSVKDTTNDEPVHRDISLQRLVLGGQYTINDILFATNSIDLNDTIKTVLNDFAEYLKINPRLHVALQGYTDNIGSPADNMLLSENRAQAVFNYLQSRGITAERMSHKGFGETHPIASNSTEEGRSRNRRTVFVVTANR